MRQYGFSSQRNLETRKGCRILANGDIGAVPAALRDYLSGISCLIIACNEDFIKGTKLS